MPISVPSPVRLNVDRFLIGGLLAVAVATAACTGVGLQQKSAGVVIVGSDTMLELNRRLAAAYMLEHPGVPIRVEGGGTRSGVEALVADTADLAAASRPLTPAEVASLYDQFKTLGVGYLMARDALSVYLNPDNPVRDLDLADVRAIFTGRISNWSEVGGPTLPITVILRPPSSGSYRFFRDHVLRGEPYFTGATIGLRTADVVDLVRSDPAAIGYGGLAYGNDLVHCAIDGVEPREENLREGRYALARYLVFYASAPPDGDARAFVEWCLGPEGQKIVREVGFIPLWTPLP
jgi:phosphate transport system substrate-binding protein